MGGFSASPYQKAASLVAQVWEQQCSVKSVIYDKKGQLRCDKRTYAQVCNVLSNAATLEALEPHVTSDDGDNGVIKNQALLYVCLYELLLGPKQSLQGGGVLKRKLLQREDKLRSILATLPQATATLRFPRYARVNTLHTSTNQVVKVLQSKNVECYKDAHVPDLLVLSPASTPELLKLDHHIVLQDKSSCFSALCLARGWPNDNKGDVLDACAAPGNKTSHLVALLANHNNTNNNESAKKTGAQSRVVVHAVERNEKRLQLLESRMKTIAQTDSAHGVSVQLHHEDYLKLTAKDVPNVTSILLDPSCSGSGIMSVDRRQDGTRTNNNSGKDNNDNKLRLQRLSNFQRTAIAHSMKSFAKVKRIVYSTCSIHEEENEQVVRDVLNENPDWQLMAPICLDHWKRRGHAIEGISSEQAACLIRVDPTQDDTNGFFVACFERKQQNNTKKKLKKQLDSNKQVNDASTDDVGLAVYNGQFSTPTKQVAKRKTTTASDNTPSSSALSQPSKKKKKKSKTTDRDSVSTPPKKEASSGNKGDDDDNDSDKPVCKKKAKKLDWKRRQKEQKLARLLKRKKT